MLPSPAPTAPASTEAVMRRSQTLLAPTESTQQPRVEFSVHTLSAAFKRELAAVFPDQKITRTSPVLLIATMQPSTCDLICYGQAEAYEKDRLLCSFFEWTRRLRGVVRELAPSAWMDATDPASGLARWGVQGGVYPDVDGFVRVLKYSTLDIGGCHVVRHPRWGLRCYPASVFTDAPFRVVAQALDIVSR